MQRFEFDRRQFLRAAAPSLVLGSVRARAWAAEEVAHDSPFLQGNFAPVHEEITAENLPVVGQLPRELRGMYVRNGPNPQFTPRGRYHWFDGDGMLHGVRLQDGRASYRNRYIRTAGWHAEREAGRALWTGLAEPLDLNQLLKGGQPFKNAANTALVWHDGRLLALWEGGPPHEIALPELKTVGPYDFSGRIKHPFTAHPKVDPVTGEMMFFGYLPMLPLVNYAVANARGEIAHTAVVRLRRPVMMHDFAVTERHSIFLELPAVFQATTPGQPVAAMRFDREQPARFGVLPRYGKAHEIRWFEATPCFMFHTLNAYEAGDEVVLIGCRMDDYPDAVSVGGSGPASGSAMDLLNSTPSRFHRWRFDMKSGQVREEPLDDVSADFPRVADAQLGRNARYGYATELASGAARKYDLHTGKIETHRHGDGRTAGEGVFEPRENPRTEDDGWLLSLVHDAASGRGELVVLDAREISQPPVARVMIPARVPYGFHGLWVGEGQLLAASSVES